MALQYADQATKNITKATPTMGQDGKVKKWAIEATYSLNGYKSTYRCEILASEFDGATKAPNAFTKDELWEHCPHAQWDVTFDSQYDSVMVQVPDNTNSNFDINSLS